MNRRYTKHSRKGRYELVSWIDRQCENCGRFLNKNQRKKYCSKCKPKMHKEYQRRYYLKHQREILERKRRKYYEEKRLL